MSRVNVKQDEQQPEPVELIAAHIIELSRSMKKIEAEKLKIEAIVILLHASTGIPKTSIWTILAHLSELESTWIKRT